MERSSVPVNSSVLAQYGRPSHGWKAHLRLRHCGLRILLVLFVSLFTAMNAQGQTRVVMSMDEGWKFFQGDPKGAESSTFDDAQWRSINVPHDWSIEGPFDQTNPTGPGGAFLPAGVGWYRK